MAEKEKLPEPGSMMNVLLLCVECEWLSASLIMVVKNQFAKPIALKGPRQLLLSSRHHLWHSRYDFELIGSSTYAKTCLILLGAILVNQAGDRKPPPLALPLWRSGVDSDLTSGYAGFGDSFGELYLAFPAMIAFFPMGQGTCEG